MSPADSALAAWVLFVAQIVTMLGLLVYVWKTWEMASATRTAAEASAKAVKDATEARLEALAPHILVYFGTEQMQWAEVVVENRGHGTATDLQIHFDPPLKASRAPGWDANKFFESAKPLFPPGYRVVHSFDMWHTYLTSDCPKRYEVRTTYRGKETGRQHSELHVLDVSTMEHRVEFDRKSVADVVRQLEKLVKATEAGFAKVQSDLDLNTAAQIYAGTTPDRPARAQLVSLLAAWDGANAIDQFAPSRLWWEPVMRYLRSMSFHAYEATRREGGSSDLSNAILGVARLLFVPPYAADEAWESSLSSAIEALRSRVNQQ